LAAPPDGARILVGLIGAGIGKSLSPAMHEEEARRQGVHLLYQRIDLELRGRSPAQLAQLLQAAESVGFSGLNITFPCKQTVIPFLDELSPQGRAMNAVNTVVFRDGKRFGHNTDGAGWHWGFQRALPKAVVGTVVLIGAGGAGSAIAHALMAMPVQELRIVDAEPGRAHTLADALCAAYGPRALAVPDAEHALTPGVNGLVHATPNGMEKMPGMPLRASLLHPSMWVSEAVYFPIETALLRAARDLGCACMDGGMMAVGQAAGAFTLFTGLRPDTARMHRHFRSLLEVV